MWADRIARCTTVEEKVALHADRWKVWDVFIYDFAKGRTIVKEVDKVKIDENEKEFQTLLDSQNVRRSRKIVGNVLFDASFGSLNSTSDLDINVISPETKVLDSWLQYLKQWYKSHKDETFTNFYDSNFYFEPSDKALQSLKLLLVNKNFQFTTEKNS